MTEARIVKAACCGVRTESASFFVGLGGGASTDADASVRTTPEEEDGHPGDEAADGGQETGVFSKNKQKHRCWEESDDVRALHAVRSVKARVALRGKRNQLFEETAFVFNEHPQALICATGRAFHDRFNAHTPQIYSVLPSHPESNQPGWNKQASVLRKCHVGG